MPKKKLTSFHMCDILNISPATLARWTKDAEKNFPKPIKIGAARLWDADEVQAYLEAQAQKAA